MGEIVIWIMKLVKPLTAEQEMQLRKPIEDYVGEIQEKIDSLREDGSNKVISLQSEIDGVKRDHGLSKEERRRRGLHSLRLPWIKRKRWKRRIRKRFQADFEGGVLSERAF